MAKLVETESEKLLNLEQALNERVIGQPEATKLVSETILRSKANINDPDCPIGSFMFLGPTGVGKTELAKALAYNLFDSERQMIRIDMSEFVDPISVNKLIGSPPGYVGYGEVSQLSDKVRQNPYSVVLFDEIEKAHPDVINILLQILDDGLLKDAKGKEINFKNTIIIMTSNLGAELVLDSPSTSRSKLTKELQGFFKPEFINRIDEIIAFHHLSEPTVEAIITNELAKLSQRIYHNQEIIIKFTPALTKYILAKGYNRVFGARPITRIIKNEIESFVAKLIISQQLQADNAYLIDFDGDQIRYHQDHLN